ncbi:SpoIIE family protein phosphatase [Cytobacillus sp. FJAT-54145]|uniref:SpoIIE family protein phosphatase n=1 Tax=Cytobacillus spartinae TaxID=3299023 RepID=A0ABW6KBN6_9BACI
MRKVKERSFKAILQSGAIITTLIAVYILNDSSYSVLDALGFHSPFAKATIILLLLAALNIPFIAIFYFKRNKVVATIKLSHNQYLALFNNPINGVYVVDKEGYVQDINLALCKMLGYVYKDIVGKHYSTFLAKKSMERLNLDRDLQPDKSLVTTEQIIHKNGEILYIEVLSVPFFDPHGKKTGLVGVAKDVTKEKMYSEQLDVLKQRYKSLFDKNPHLACIIDKDGKITETNQTFQDHMGSYKVGVHFKEIIAKDSVDETINLFHKALEGETVTGTNELTGVSGNKIYIDYKSIPIMVNGSLEGIFVVARDITEESRLESLVKKDLQLANLLQHSVISKPLHTNEINISGYFVLANTVGGDLYVWYQIDDGRYGVLILDVMGHGVSSALISMSIRSLLEGLITRVQDPILVMEELNRHMYQLFNFNSTDSVRYFTSIYMLIDTKLKEIKYVNAGHPSGILSYSDKTYELMESNCPPLGLMKKINIESSSIQYEGRTKIILYTDGVLESTGMKRAGEAISVIANAFTQNPNLECEAFVLEALNKRKAPTEDQDDISILKVDLF